MSIAERRAENLLLLSVIILMIVNGTAIVIVSPLTVDIAESFGTSVSVIGQLRTVSALMSGMLAPFVGVLSDKFGRRPVLASGLFTIAGFGLGSALAPSFVVILLIHAVAGFGVAALLATGFALAGDAFPPERRARAVGIISIGPAMAWVLGLPLIGVVGDLLGWRASFVAIPVVFSIIGLLFLRWIPSGGAPPGAGNVRVFSDLSTVAKIPSARAWIFAELLSYSGWTGTLVYLGAYYITVHDRSTSSTGFLMASTALAFVFGSLASHRVSGRIGAKQAIFVTSIISAVLLVMAFTLSPPLPISQGLLMAFAVSQGIRGAAASVLAMLQLTERHGLMMGFRASVTQFGYVLGSLVGGLLLAAGGFTLLGISFALMLISASIITMRWVRE